MSAIEEQMREASQDLANQQEKYLREVIAALGITVEEFARDYYIEEHPSETTVLPLSNDLIFFVRQKFRVRRKTNEGDS